MVYDNSDDLFTDYNPRRGGKKNKRCREIFQPILPKAERHKALILLAKKKERLQSQLNKLDVQEG